MTGESLPQVMGGTTVARWIRAARNDASVKAIVLRVDSPGGSSVGSDVIAREVALARKAKPVIVSMSDVAGSGGYWIAMPATKIVAQPQTLTGSIGVLAGKFSVDGLLGEARRDRGEARLRRKGRRLLARSGPSRPRSARSSRSEILWTYEQFLAKAAEGRGLTRDEVDAVGKGPHLDGPAGQGHGSSSTSSAG